jgi:hypothetical protein
MISIATDRHTTFVVDEMPQLCDSRLWIFAVTLQQK